MAESTVGDDKCTVASGSGSEEDDDGPVGKGRKTIVPRFLQLTYQMIEEKTNWPYVSWNEKGDTVVIKNLHQFAEKVLPKYFKHKRASSFVRQLNMYGFNRCMDYDNGFKHPKFIRGHPEDLDTIKRKASRSKDKSVGGQDLSEAHKQEMNELLDKLGKMNDRQQELENQVFDLRAKHEHLDTENLELWKVINEAKRRNQQVIMKMREIFKFMAHFAQQDPAKRLDGAPNMPRLLEDSEQLIKESESVFNVPPRIAEVRDGPYSIDASLLGGEGSSNDLVRIETIKHPLILDAPPGADVDTPNFQGNQFPLSPGGIISPEVLSPEIAPLGKSSVVSADDLVRGASLRSFMDEPQYSEKYPDLVRGVSQLVSDQDDTLRRINSLSSALDGHHDISLDEDPFFDIDAQRSNHLDLDLVPSLPPPHVLPMETKRKESASLDLTEKTPPKKRRGG